MANYSKFSDKDLISVYNDMMDYSGKPDSDITREIEKRGGLDVFLKRINDQELLTTERNRISVEVLKLIKNNADLDTAKYLISSEVFDVEELHKIIGLFYERQSKHEKDKTIDSKTIILSVLGSLFGILISTFLFVFLSSEFYKIYYLFIVFIYLICYSSIKTISGKSKLNLFVFILSVISTIISFILGLWWMDILKNLK